MSEVTKKIAAGFVRYQKERPRRVPPRYIGPAPANQVPAAFAPEANEVLPPPVTDHERAGARQQAAEIAVMAQPIIERFSAEDQLVQTLTKLVATLNALIESAPLAKQEPATVAPARGKRFVRMIEQPLPLRPARPNSLDLIVDDAAGRVAVSKKYNGSH